MRNRSGFCFKSKTRYWEKICMILAALVLLMITGCTTSIHQAAETGNLKKIKALLKENPTLVNEKDSYGMTALHWAVDKRRFRAAEMLIEEGADVNAADKNGETPLFYATNQEYIGRMATMLMLNGAKLPGGEDEVRDMLKQIAPLHQAARNDRLKDVETFLEKYPDQVNARDNSDRTPLYWAARANHIDVCEALLAAGADVNAATRDGWTPLHTAVYNKKPEAVELLLANGAEVNVQNSEGETPLHWAARRGKKNLVEPLLSKGANLKTKDNDGKIPIDWADDDDIIELLRRHGTGD